MRYLCAPMEGVTGYLFRNVHHRYFPGVDDYYIPFVSPNHSRSFTKKELAELLPAHNEGLSAIPQLLCRGAEDFLWAAGELEAMGYREVNLNLGCPSGTVTAKGKGSGFLLYPQELDQFLDQVFSAVRLRVSIKTRLGYHKPEEFSRLLDIYNQYPLTRLIIHPRVRQDFYKGQPRRADFAAALPRSRHPVCYNGDLTSAADCGALAAEFPAVSELMLGRGLVGDPALIRQCQGGAQLRLVRRRAALTLADEGGPSTTTSSPPTVRPSAATTAPCSA